MDLVAGVTGRELYDSDMIPNISATQTSQGKDGVCRVGGME